MPGQSGRIAKRSEVKGPARPARRRQPDEVRARIMEAGLAVFTRDGYAGATLRAIAADAGTTVQLLLYHVKSKEELWKAVMTEAFDTFFALFERQSLAPDAPLADRLRQYIATMVEFSATKPQMLRVMVQEAGQMTPRLVWLIENHTSRIYRIFEGLIEEGQRAGIVRDLPPLRIYYAMVAIASLPFSISGEYEYLAGKSPFTPSEIERTIELIDEFVFA